MIGDINIAVCLDARADQWAWLVQFPDGTENHGADLVMEDAWTAAQKALRTWKKERQQ